MPKNEVKKKYKNMRGRIGVALEREEGVPAFKSRTYERGDIIELTEAEAARYPKGKLELAK